LAYGRFTGAFHWKNTVVIAFSESGETERLTPNWSPGVTIGESCVIGAGSVVTKDIPENSLAVGNPCRVIRKINLEKT